jgi:hypothetical protein
MVANVARAYRPRIGIVEPLTIRWECLRERVARNLPDHHPDRSVLQLPMDEYTCDALEDVLAKYEQDKAAAVEQPSPALKAILDEIMEWRRRRARSLTELREHQKQARRVVNDRAHQILHDIPVNFNDAFEPVSLAPEHHPKYAIASLAAARRAASDEMALTLSVEGLLAQLRAVIHFHHLPGDEQNRLLIDALHDRIERLEAKLKKAKVAA